MVVLTTIVWGITQIPHGTHVERRPMRLPKKKKKKEREEIERSEKEKEKE